MVRRFKHKMCILVQSASITIDMQKVCGKLIGKGKK